VRPQVGQPWVSIADRRPAGRARSPLVLVFGCHLNGVPRRVITRCKVQSCRGTGTWQEENRVPDQSKEQEQKITAPGTSFLRGAGTHQNPTHHRVVHIHNHIHIPTPAAMAQESCGATDHDLTFRDSHKVRLIVICFVRGVSRFPFGFRFRRRGADPVAVSSSWLKRRGKPMPRQESTLFKVATLERGPEREYWYSCFKRAWSVL
jgi:hypothetical protein